MKKLFFLMATALMSVAMMAGENDLLWDYTEGAPKNNPDNGLYYEGKITDGPGKNNGLYGIKLNSSGYACFSKAAVAGKLKLTFGPRSGSNAADIQVWDWDGITPAKGANQYATTGQQTELGTQIVDLTAEQNNIYLCRGINTETCLQKIQFVEEQARTFVDFKIEFRDNPYSVILPESGELPAGVTVEGTTYNGGQHGVQGGTITVPVDGTVKFTIGGCQHSQSDITVKKDGEYYATVSNKIDKCGKTTGVYEEDVPYIYLGEAGVLTFEFGSQTYVPYFFAEATDITPCEIIFKDQNGAELGRVETYEGATLAEIPYTETDLPSFGDNERFRGWFYSNNKKAKIGDPITGNTTILAKVTPIEEATVGSVQTYDFANAAFYPEDHETVMVEGGSYYNNHGWYFNADGSINVAVAGNAVVIVTLCKYSESGDVKVMAGETELAKYTVVKNETPDGTELTAKYSGEAGWLTINWTAKQYIHKVVVYNVLDFLEKDEKTGYYIVPSNDVASFLMALVQAESGDKIFLPNGTYDLGETVLTTISKNNISIIGQSMENTIIKNAPDAAKESIDQTATLKINKNVEGTYLQDLTIQNALDYYKNNNGRAVALWDQGTQTVCKNVKLLSYQDTYYSNLVGAVRYFETSEIHGTVDFICGDGSVYFYDTELVCEQRSTNGGGSDALTASNADASDKGYVFDHCTVRYAEGIQGNLPVVSFGRSWNNKPKTVFLYTFLDDSNGELIMTKGASAQKDKIERWTLGAMNALPECFGEYYSVNAQGENISPESNDVTFVLGTNEKQMETILTENQAAQYTMAYTLGNWSETAAFEAKQEVCNLQNIDPEGVYLVEVANGNAVLFIGAELEEEVLPEGAIVRKANTRGGFGLPADDDPAENIENKNVVSSSKVTKTFRNGQLIIVRDNKTYNVLGAQL